MVLAAGVVVVLYALYLGNDMKLSLKVLGTAAALEAGRIDASSTAEGSSGRATGSAVGRGTQCPGVRFQTSSRASALSSFVAKTICPVWVA